MNYEAVLRVVKKIIVPQGAKLVQKWDEIKIATVKDKERLDIATTLDQEIERELVQELKTQFPETGLLLEEGTSADEEAEYRWAIDPIDGTKYYASRIPLFTISVGLLRNMKPELGVIYNPISKQLYEGSIATPARMNEQLIKIRPEDSLPRSVVSVDFHSHKQNSSYHTWEREVLHTLHTTAYRIRILGSGSLSLAWLASGSLINAYIVTIPPTKLVDVAAGLAIAEAAGAHVEAISNPANTEQTIFIVGSEAIVKEIKDIIT